jgi:heparin binding hemagglutinin HbhA
MPKTTPITRPLYFAAGATDLAVEKLREIPAEYKRLQLQAKKFDSATLRVAVEDYSAKASGKAAEVYTELVGRGTKVVDSIRRQKATQVLSERLTFTQRQAKATATTARKGAAQTRTRAKATATSAKKTAEAASEATSAAADKVDKVG